MKDPAYTVECARIHDTAAMLNLEREYFDPCWHSEAALIRGLIEQEPRMFRVCKVNGKVKGYYWVFPLEHSIWNQIISGEMPEGDLVKHIRSFDEPDLYLYISSVIVDQTDKLRKSYTKALVHDFGRRFVLGNNSAAPDVRAIGAFTISEGGRHLMERAKFSYQGKFRAHGKEMKSWAIDRRTLAHQTISDRQQRQTRKIA
jgi:hypothetical protein